LYDHWELEVTTSSTRPAKLLGILEECGAQVRSEGQTFYITHPYVPASSTHQEALDRAQKLIASLGFLIRRLHALPADLTLKDLTGYGEDGGKHLFVSTFDAVSFSCEVEIEVRNSIGGLIPPPKLPTDRWKSLLLDDPNVSLVCELLSKSPIEWNDLYRSVEIIAEDLGGLHKIHELDWATKESLRRFKHTANSPSSIGLNARHGVDQGQPPSAPMIHSEAAALIDTIVYQWIWSKT
jgi:hypothetical protein